MNGRLVTTLLVSTAAVVLVVWIALNTYWVEVPVRGLLKGEALRNPFYAGETLLRHLGVDATEHNTLEPLQDSTDALVLYNWNWDLFPERRDRIKHWVEAGGRLVTDLSMGYSSDFKSWSGIHFDRNSTKEPREEEAADRLNLSNCLDLRLTTGEVLSDLPDGEWRLCDAGMDTHLIATGHVELALSRKGNRHVIRASVGRGSVTVINGYSPFITTNLLDGDHAHLLVIAAQVTAGDKLRFMRGDQRLSLIGWAWKVAAPALLLLALVIALALWRTIPRFGPPMASQPPGRRSLRSQIQGTASFLHRHGGDDQLWQASRQALQAAAAQHSPVSPAVDKEIHDALAMSAPTRREQLPRALATLERARRMISHLQAKAQKRDSQ